MRTLFLLLLLVVLLALPANANLIVNGGFETGNFSGWDVSGATVYGFDYGITNAGPHSGTYAAYFGAMTGNTSLSQTLSTIPGQLYDGSFWIGNTNQKQPADNLIQVIWDGNVVLNGSNVPDAPWTHEEGMLAATGTSTTIEFVFHNVPGWFNLDDVSVDAVPEPNVGFLC